MNTAGFNVVAPIQSPELTNRPDKATRFRKGNPGGPGNPYVKQTHQLRAALMKAVTKEDIGAIAKGLIRKAKQGDVGAAHELFDRLFGKANQPMEVAATVNGETKVTHRFDHGRFAELYRRLASGTDASGAVPDAPDRN